MAKTAKSQWDFGDLFSPAATRRILTVSDLTGQIHQLLEAQIGHVWITGEITNLRAQSSGHIYFTLKDAISQLSCVLFRGEALSHRHLLEDGQKVVLEGDITVYEARGQYQLRVTGIELQGVGALQLAFEKLKQKLQAEGLFAQERKRPLPPYPRRIGIVTSATGAALQDVLHVINRRHPGLDIVLASCRVQGQGAAEEIASAIRLLDEWNQRQNGVDGLDLILVTRGGGSLEDLWAFNEEIVARAVFESRLPMVSAVGHEIDFTICDFVADVRAATPSAAAEILTEGHFASRQFVALAAERLREASRQLLHGLENQLQILSQRLLRCHPRRRLNEDFQHLDDLQVSLRRSVFRRTVELETKWRVLRDRLARVRPSELLSRRRENLHHAWRRLIGSAEQSFQGLNLHLENTVGKLRLLSPHNVLERGYSITMDASTGKVIREVTETRKGQTLKTLLKSGEIESIVGGSTSRKA